LNKDLEEVRGEPCRQLRKANRLRKQHVQRAQLVYHRDSKEVSRAEAQRARSQRAGDRAGGKNTDPAQK
jgi:hypothetical protein